MWALRLRAVAIGAVALSVLPFVRGGVLIAGDTRAGRGWRPAFSPIDEACRSLQAEADMRMLDIDLAQAVSRLLDVRESFRMRGRDRSPILGFHRADGGTRTPTGI